MNRKLDSVIDSSLENSDCNVVAKLRKLKIQEGLLVKNINKIGPKEHDGEVGLPMFYSLEFNHFAKKVKDSFAEINIKFGDIKSEAEEKLSCLDIKTMRRDVEKLDEKISTFKNYLQSEMMSTTSKDEELTKRINNTEERQTNTMFKAKLRKNIYKHIVPSPVKVIIKSPFRCKEVQDLQEFMMQSTNRYGGWNEYNHNIFVQIWQKHFVRKDEFKNHDPDIAVDNIEAFVKEILHRIAGTTTEDVISHRHWYSKYLYLKEQQQTALNKWRKNQRILTKTNNIKHQGNQNRILDKKKPFNSNNSQILDLMSPVETNDTEEIVSALRNLSLENENFVYRTEIDMNYDTDAASNISADTKEKRSPTHGGVLRPTEQWTNRCNSLRDSIETNNNIDNIRKLRIPVWRLILKD